MTWVFDTTSFPVLEEIVLEDNQIEHLVIMPHRFLKKIFLSRNPLLHLKEDTKKLKKTYQKYGDYYGYYYGDYDEDR